MQEKFIARCFELAKLGETYAFPNPIVGAVIVNKGNIIGEGFHQIYGKEHAEVNAVNAVLAKYPGTHEQVLAESEIYVSLEPCNHIGKTPPCTELIKKYKFKKLIFAIHDPNPDLDHSRAIAFEAIQKNGTEIVFPKTFNSHIKEEAYFINRIFFENLKKKKNNHHLNNSWITLKLASYENGSMIIIKDDKWISNSESRKEVHRLRSCHNVLITGINSIKKDNSRLNLRFSKDDLNLAEIRQPEIIILKSNQDFSLEEREVLSVFKNPKVTEIKTDRSSEALYNLIKNLTKNQPKRVLVEAGPNLIESFLKANLFDEIIHYIKLETENYSDKYLEKLSNKFLENYQSKIKDNDSFLKISKLQIIKSKSEPSNLKLTINKLEQ